MKKIYLSLFSAFLFTGVTAQITLTSTNCIPSIGESYSYQVMAGTMSVSNGGANQTWDFSGVSGAITNVNYIDLSSSQEPSTFPSANLVEVFPTGEQYYTSSPSELSIQGQYAVGQLRAIYVDARELLKFPLSYQTVYNETFQGTVENIGAAQTFDRTGNITIEADGHGDLILPYKTISNVLRVKITSVYQDSFQGTPIYSYNEVSYFWYDGINNNYLAAYNELSANGSVVSTNSTILDENDYTVGINNPSKIENVLSFYPNPANSEITLTNVTDIQIINILDLKGQTVKTVSIQNENQKVNISDLNSGMYFIQYISNKKSYMDKLIIE